MVALVLDLELDGVGTASLGDGLLVGEIRGHPAVVTSHRVFPWDEGDDSGLAEAVGILEAHEDREYTERIPSRVGSFGVRPSGMGGLGGYAKDHRSEKEGGPRGYLHDGGRERVHEGAPGVPWV